MIEKWVENHKTPVICPGCNEVIRGDDELESIENATEKCGGKRTDKTTKELRTMSDSKCQRLDAISDRDQMAEREPCEHAKRFMKRPAYYGVLGYLRHKNINTGEEIGRGAGSENRERTEEGIPPEL